jgi:hypothetical protein
MTPLKSRNNSHIGDLLACTGYNDMLLNREQAGVFLQPSSHLFEHVLDNPQIIISLPQHQTGSDNLQWKIPPSEWPMVLLRMEQAGPLHKVAREYGVSPEAVGRVIRAVHKGTVLVT